MLNESINSQQPHDFKLLSAKRKTGIVSHNACLNEAQLAGKARPAPPCLVAPNAENNNDHARTAPPDANNHTINCWPTLERPREKLAATGAATLSNAELLAIFLRTGVAGQNAVDLGRTLLNRFGSLRALLSASSAELQAVRGIGAAKVAQLHAIGELVQRSLAEELQENTSFDSPAAVRDYLKLLIGARPYEVFACLYLDARYRLIRAEEPSRGTLTHTAVYPREIARRALLLNAAALIVAHNHPSGATQPSAADRRLTKQLQSSLELFDIKLLDHFIIATNAILSFSEQGWI